MEIKEGYKQTEIGVIPCDWIVKAISKEIDLLTGYPFPSNKYSNEGIKLLRGSNIKRGVIDWSEDITQYWEKLTHELKTYILDEGDIVIAMDGSLVGRSFARLTKKDLPALLLQRVARIRSSKIDQGYLKEFLCSDYFSKYCDSVKTVTAIPHISPRDIRKFTIPIPPTLIEQTAIATALSDVDTLISSLEKLIAKKQNIKQGAMQELLTGKKRLPGFSGDWEVKKLGDIASINRGASPRPIDSPIWFNENSRIGWVRISDVTKSIKYLYETTQKLSEQGIKCSHFVPKNNLIMSICATVGRPIITRLDVCIHDGFVVFNNPKIEKEYLYYYLSFIEESWSKNGQTGSQMNLNTTIIQSEEIPVPQREEQIVIAQILSDMDADIEALERKLAKYRMIKQGMMQMLLTGKIRLI
ncbi:MAG: restriction endonuclease subunit S [Bacteroidetes bacterium]|nr:restriction endonuclease subunit S [Bacteroidota bacterium]